MAIVSWNAQAGTIDVVLDPTVFGTAVALPSASSNIEVSSIAYGDGAINLRDWGTPSTLTYDPDGTGWTGGSPVFATTSAGIEISFARLNVVAFTFNIFANQTARAWVQAFSGGNLMDDTGWFGGIGYNSPRSVGVYASAGSGTCIDRIVVDPTFTWGVGDFTIATDAGCNAEAVPIPGAAVLFLSGLAGLGAWSRRRKLAAV